MSDQCENCTLRGNYEACIKTPCCRHDSWIDLERIEKIEKLESENDILRHRVQCCKTADEAEKLTDEDIDKLLKWPVPGGSHIADWFIPHESKRGKENIVYIIRTLLSAANLLSDEKSAPADTGEAAGKWRCPNCDFDKLKCPRCGNYYTDIRQNPQELST